MNEPEDNDVALGGTLASFIAKQQERALERDQDYDRDKDYKEERVNPTGSSGPSAYVPPRY